MRKNGNAVISTLEKVIIYENDNYSKNQFISVLYYQIII